MANAHSRSLRAGDDALLLQLLERGPLREKLVERVVALAGPSVSRPRLVLSRLGADLQALVAGESEGNDARLLSGSVLGGRAVQSDTAYLGRYHQQVTLLPEGRDRAFMGWLSPGVNKHSVMGIYLSSWFGSKPLAMSTNTNGSERAMVPVGAYEKVMPLDILLQPTI